MADYDADDDAYYSGDESDLESDEDMEWNDKEVKTKKNIRGWYSSYKTTSGQEGTIDHLKESVKDRLKKKFAEEKEDNKDDELVADDTYCYQISDSSDAEDPREGADMGRDFYWNPSDDSSASEMENEELEQIDPDDPVVDQDSFQPDPLWNSTVDPQVGLWGTNHPHAPFPGSTMKWHSIVWDDGTTYEGLSRENIPHAYGTLVLGNAYAGNLVEPNVGRGVKYEGMFRAGAVEGLGQMSWPKGQVYRGEWVQGQKHGCGAMYDFSPMLKLTKEGKNPAEAWEKCRDEIMSKAKMGTWYRDNFISDPIDSIEAGLIANSVTPTSTNIDPKDLCDRPTIDGVIQELDSVVQRARMFQHKPDGEVAIRFLQDGRGTPAPVMQDPIFYPHDTKWMAPGPVGQAYALPDDAQLKDHLKKVAENYHKIYKMYNLPWDQNTSKDADYKKSQEYWPEEYFQEGPNSAWWYKNVLFPLEKEVEENVKFHATKDTEEYRKKGKDALKQSWSERSKAVVDQFLERKGWAPKSADEKKQMQMLKDFIKDCDDVGFMSSWKLLNGMELGMEERRKDIKKVGSDSKAKDYKRKEFLFRIEDLQKNFKNLDPSSRKEKGRMLVNDIVEYGFLKEFCRNGELEVAEAKGSNGQVLAQFSRLKGRDWDEKASKKVPKHIVNPIVDPINIEKLPLEDRLRWQKVLDYLYNDLPEDESVMMTLLNEEQQEFVEFYKKKYRNSKKGGTSNESNKTPVVPPTNLASLSIGLTRFSFYINKSMSYVAKRAVRHDVFKRKK